MFNDIVQQAIMNQDSTDNAVIHSSEDNLDHNLMLQESSFYQSNSQSPPLTQVLTSDSDTNEINMNSKSTPIQPITQYAFTKDELLNNSAWNEMGKDLMIEEIFTNASESVKDSVQMKIQNESLRRVKFQSDSYQHHPVYNESINTDIYKQSPLNIVTSESDIEYLKSNAKAYSYFKDMGVHTFYTLTNEGSNTSDYQFTPSFHDDYPFYHIDYDGQKIYLPKNSTLYFGNCKRRYELCVPPNGCNCFKCSL
jgi:hypothetical protein